jgi:CheY-like chemotaxis protein
MKKKIDCVLLVDDDESDNYYHKRILEKSGIAHRIEIVENGKEALDFLSAAWRCGQTESSGYQPELIFLDINMPVMNGWEFLEEYEKLEEVQKENMIIIMLTNSLNPNDLNRAEKLFGSGCYQYKPLTPEVIGKIMQHHFPDNL